tara:strand:- start:1167 stop:2207 length:1041 start_codon:yes stop_codon:yes gene_type:complete
MDKKNLIIDSRPYGFFSIFLHTIDNLKWADDNGYEPHIRWGPGRVDVNEGRPGAEEASRKGHPSFVGNSPNFFEDSHAGEVKKSLYYSPSGYNGSDNVWEYYFEPVGTSETKEHKVSDIFQVGFHDLKLDSLNDKFLIYNLHSYTPLTTWLYFRTDPEAESTCPSEESTFLKHRRNVNQYIKKYVKLRSNIENKVKEYTDRYFDGPVIGVHVRGTDKKSESKIGQRPFVTIDDYLRVLEDTLGKFPDASIFVASDNNEAIAKIFKKFVNNKIIVYNCTRMKSYDSIIPVHLSSQSGPKAGEEALIDCLLLSECNHIICTDSNLSAAALYFNPAATCTYINKHLEKK